MGSSVAKKARPRFLFLESFYGGSHKAFADGLAAHSRHRIDLVTLPARFWKWRMRGAALEFRRRIPDPTGYHGLIVTDLMSLSDLKSLWAARCPPALVYFHENQLSYPLPEGERMDYHFGFTDITTALAADRVLFNSHTHRMAFLEGLGPFLRRLPEHRPLWAAEEIRRKSDVLYPGYDFGDAGPGGGAHGPGGKSAVGESESAGGAEASRAAENGPPLIIWNHRWEFDKDPEAFFAAVNAAADRGHPFRLALLGENFQSVPQAFEEAKRRHATRIVRYGWEPSRRAYLSWLRRGDIVVSTAIQENFGISVVEAVRCGCYPLLPLRLSYPELLPEEFHGPCLYSSSEELTGKLCALLADPRGFWREQARMLARHMERFSWNNLIDRYDEELQRLTEAEN